MSERSEPEELLDGAGLTFEDRARALADLARSNRLLFGYRIVRRTLLPLIRSAGRSSQWLLDLGAGSGDVSRDLACAARDQNLELRVVAIDSQLAHLVLARRGSPETRSIVADVRALPLRDGAVHWSFCHLLLHHFDLGSAEGVLDEMRRVCRLGAVVVDLRGSWLLRLGVTVLLPLLGIGPVGRHDGRVSARKAHRLSSLGTLLARIPRTDLRRRFPCRFSLLLPPLASHAKDHRECSE